MSSIQAKKILKEEEEQKSHILIVNDNGIIREKKIADIFESTVIDQGKFNKNTAWELREGTKPSNGFFRTRKYNHVPLYKVNVVSYDEKDQELKREIGYTTEKKESAINWISKEREKRIKIANALIAKQKELELKERIKKEKLQLVT